MPVTDAKKTLYPGLSHPGTVHHNLSGPVMVECAVRRGEGMLSASGALVVRTGVHTGRSVNDKFVVEEPESRDSIWWGKVNRPISAEHFTTLRQRVLAYLQGRELFVQDLYAGADPAFRLKVRVITTGAWHAAFARNMFIRPPAGDLAGFTPDWTILHAPDFRADPAIDGSRSDSVIALSFAQRTVVIGGTSYAGEIKKSVFTILNYLLPERGVLPMHCSANIGKAGDVALFFGLSGTGKTTLSSDPNRTLIGDDEHGWGANGVFNFEGGCYAKVIRLSEQAEPEIWAASHRFGSVLENVVCDPATRALDLDDGSLTENTRSCYPVEFIPNASREGRGGQPRNVVMLTADAFGVLPPIAKLSPAQAMYHFLSGYTARVAGTEKGLGKEPQATFSTCFGAPFIPRHPTVYGKMLSDLLKQHDATCWLVNTGWSGGSYGTGKRMAIAHTRALLRAALDGKLAQAPTVADPFFGLAMPTACEGVPADVLNPRNTWADKGGYDRTARDLVVRFEENFRQFETAVGDDVKAAAIRAAA
ncbi:MAG: phosphoenolpyruvate carboxykinase [Alphaproteobacteria bacterium]|nr:phosphoenolpyruvate carboxykinase [Alphaproteobacteria bacterium]